MSEPTAPDLAAQLQAAIAHHQAGELAEAEQGYRAILAEQANHPDAWHNLGILALQVEQHDTALELLRSELRPGDVVLVKASNAAGLGALAEALVAGDQRPVALVKEGLDAIERVLAGSPGFPRALALRTPAAPISKAR